LRQEEETSPPARRPSAGAVPGRRGDCWAVRTPPAASRPLTDGRTIRPATTIMESAQGLPGRTGLRTFSGVLRPALRPAPPRGPAFFLVLARPSRADYSLWHPLVSTTRA